MRRRSPVGAKTNREAAMEPIEIGQRVRVIDGQLVHYRQLGTVVAIGKPEGCYVHLDYDEDRPDSQIFFHTEELEPAPDAPPPGRRAHWSSGAGLDHRPDPDAKES
jgi:hypothetical protein